LAEAKLACGGDERALRREEIKIFKLGHGGGTVSV
jgi:hypothetical protein